MDKRPFVTLEKFREMRKHIQLPFTYMMRRGSGRMHDG